jgi:DNA repair exonuclease SbcCD nuclease subunit
MKFLHAADIHLDSPLSGLRARADLPGEVIAHCTRRALSAMIDLAVAEDVAFVVIAGDLYDGNWRDFSTGLFFASEMQRLNRPCFLLRGNHDARSVITSKLRLPSNVREFSSRTCETFELMELGVALHGHSFPKRAVPEDLSLHYRNPLPGLLNIGVLHTSAEDPGEHETYAPCRVDGLRLKGYDYWALGHIHDRRVLSDSPWIVFPGNLQGRHIREAGAKGCSLVTVADGRIAAVEHRSVDVLRWTTLAVDAEGADIGTLLDRIGTAAQAAIAGGEERPILARLVLSGATELHGRLLGDTDNLAAECRNAAIEVGGALWVEDVRVHTRPVRAVARDALRPLRGAFLAALEDTTLTATLLEDLQAVRQRLPGAAQANLELPDDHAGLAALADEAWEIAAAAIAGADPQA